MASLGEAVFDLAANTKPLAEGMKEGQKITKDATAAMQQDTEKNAGGIGGILGGIGNVAGGIMKAGLIAGTAAVVGIVGALGGCISAAMGAEQTTKQLEAVLASTGGKAGMTKEAVIGLADSLSQVTMFEDDAIVAGESMLLTFTNIGADVFPMATEAMLDMSQATGQDMQSSAVMLGKALNDPIAGISALSRVGVTFTQGQKDAIAAMMAMGDTAGAQKIMLAELQTEFGGSARAAGTTFAGQFTILKNGLGNVAENIGTAFLPALTSIASTLVGTLNKPEVQAAITSFAGRLATGFQQIIGWVQANWPTIQAVISTVFTVIGQVIGVIINDVIPALVGVFQSVYAWVQANWPTIQGIIESVFAVVGSVINFVVQNVIPILVAGFQSIFSWVQTNWPAIQATIETVIGVISDVIQTVMGAVATFWDTNGQTILTVAQTVWGMIENLVRTVIGVVQGIIQTAMALIHGDWEGAWNGIKGIITTVWEGIKTHIGLVLEVLKTIIPAAWAFIKGAAEGAWNGIKGVISGVWDGIQGAISGAADSIKGGLSGAWASIKSTADGAWNGIKATIGGVWDGIKTAISTAASAVGTSLGTAWTTIQTTAGTAWNSVKTTIGGVWEGITTAVSTAVDGVRLAMGNGWNTIFTAAGAAFGNIKNAILAPLNDAKGLIDGIISGIIGAWQRLGSFHIPLPHFRAGVKWSEVAGISFPIPDIGIDWYGKGLAPTLFNQPTMIGVGERGPELVSVMPLSSGLGAVPSQLSAAGAGADMYQSQPTVNRHFELTYHAIRPQSGRFDAARAMREIALTAELEG